MHHKEILKFPAVSTFEKKHEIILIQWHSLQMMLSNENN